MTLCISWVRKIGKTEELVTVSDSRLRFGCAWDSCPKITYFDRGDCVMCFAGDTQYAYPMIQQVYQAVKHHQRLNDRVLDITELRGHIMRIMTRMRRYIHDLRIGQKEPEVPETQFLLSGYSWKLERFCIWEIYYNENEKAFNHREQATINKNHVGVIGDEVKKIRRKIHLLLEAKGKSPDDHLDMEPFEVLRDVIREQFHPAIGGPPQIVKIYKHMNAMPYCVYWPNKESRGITFLGRPLLDYELFPHLILDPDTLQTEPMKTNMKRISDDGKF